MDCWRRRVRSDGSRASSGTTTNESDDSDGPTAEDAWLAFLFFLILLNGFGRSIESSACTSTDSFSAV